MTRRFARVALPALLAAAAVTSRPAEGQIAVSSNDNKVVLVNGAVTVVRNPAPDTATIIDLGVFPPRVLAEINVPGSVVGPPFSVAITPDQGLALITSSTKVDPSDPTKTVPDNRLSVVDLRAAPPAVIATLETGRSPAGLSINRQGTLALVANRSDGTVSVFGIQGRTVTALGTVRVADDKSGTSHVAITPDGKTALVTRDNDSTISLLSIDGTKVEYTKHDLSAGLRPYGLDIAADGSVAVVANIGRGGGDNDTVSVIDLRLVPPRVVETVTVGQTPEGIRLSPDGKLLAVQVMNGSNKPKDSPFYAPNGKLLLYRVEGTRLVPLAAAWVGQWSQGIAFSPDSKTILVQNMVEKDIQVLRWDGSALLDTGQRIKTNGGPAAIRTVP
ncbi:MAG TPA: YncE family protein [Candidatus Methylomirabilis sp.]|nr:YncE family protein [Candidatus Methylomirabilis sp.]